MKRIFFLTGSLALLFSTGCSSTLSQPFQNLKAEPITVYRLQNYEPPAAAAPGAAVPGIPPQIQSWLSGAASLLPPGLLPPGLLPGGTPAPPSAANVPRFHNFRILGTMQVTDQKQHDEILDLFGHESNFETPRQSCMFAEFGFQVGQSQLPADILVSLSCDQVSMINYGWPYGTKTGIPADSAKRVIAIVQKAFGG